jgi:heptosyltransferase II
MLPSMDTLSLLIRCFSRVLAFGPASSRGTPRAICIIQTAQMGDMVCTTPMFRAVKKAYPECKVYVVGTVLNKEILAGNPDVDGYLVWQHDINEMSKKIKELHCDFGCTTSPNFSGLAALCLAGVPSIAAPRIVGGWSPTETKSYRLLRKLAFAIPHGFESYAPREYLRLLEPIGIHTDDTKKYIFCTREARASVTKKLVELAGKPYTVMSPSAGNKIKRWPSERFAEVAEHIAHKYMPVVVIGAVPDREEVAQMMSHVKNPLVHNFSEQLSIEELKALIARASLFVSVDTGPLYIAEAFDIPTIDIVGPVSEKDQPPSVPPKHIVITPPRSRPAMFAMNGRVYDEKEAQRQASTTSAAEVIKVVGTLLTGAIISADQIGPDTRELQDVFQALLRKYMKVSAGSFSLVSAKEKDACIKLSGVLNDNDPSVFVCRVYQALCALERGNGVLNGGEHVDIPHRLEEVVSVHPAWQYNVISALRSYTQSRLKQYVSLAMVHGSFATGDFVDGWSDLDTVFILREEVFSSPEKLRRARRDISRTALICYVIDPLAHHEFITLTPFDVRHYSEDVLPIAAWREALLLAGDATIKLRTRPIKKGPSRQLEIYLALFRRKVEEHRYSENCFEWKQDLSAAFLLPALALETHGLYVYKRESFSLAKSRFPCIDWSPIEKASNIRNTWQTDSLVQYIPSGFFFHGPEIMRQIVLRLLAPTRNKPPMQTPMEIQSLTGEFLRLTESICSHDHHES